MAQRVRESIEVAAPVQDAYSYWANVENFSNFMRNVAEVRVTGRDTSHWRVKGPLGKSVEFDAKTTEMDPSRGIGWNTTGGEVMTSGEARFERVAFGRTRVDVTMNYADPPGGKVGELAAKVLQNPESELREDLQNFARIVEGASWAVPAARRPIGRGAGPDGGGGVPVAVARSQGTEVEGPPVCPAAPRYREGGAASCPSA